MNIKKSLLIGGAIVLVLLVAAVGALYAVLTLVVLPLRDGTRLGDDSVTTIVTGHFGPIPIGAYAIVLADGGVALVDAGMDANGTAILEALARMGKAAADVRAILLTHGHNDHAAGALAFPAAPTYVMEADAAEVEAIRGRDGRRIVVTRRFTMGNTWISRAHPSRCSVCRDTQLGAPRSSSTACCSLATALPVSATEGFSPT